MRSFNLACPKRATGPWLLLERENRPFASRWSGTNSTSGNARPLIWNTGLASTQRGLLGPQRASSFTPSPPTGTWCRSWKFRNLRHQKVITVYNCLMFNHCAPVRVYFIFFFCDTTYNLSNSVAGKSRLNSFKVFLEAATFSLNCNVFLFVVMVH